MTAMLNKLGDNHKRHHVSPSAFPDFKDVLMEVLKRHLGALFTSEAELSWDRAMNFVNRTVTVRLV
ncbi:UNVERIFIED_CONTAM: hypothetical protein B566_EDAN018197 [Ephemera danica]|nr:hypothetical protein B566_EDAN018197 [Ephemera danica]